MSSIGENVVLDVVRIREKYMAAARKPESEGEQTARLRRQQEYDVQDFFEFELPHLQKRLERAAGEGDVVCLILTTRIIHRRGRASMRYREVLWDTPYVRVIEYLERNKLPVECEAMLTRTGGGAEDSYVGIYVNLCAIR